MFKKKYRNIIPSTEETQKAKDKSTHFEYYYIGGIDDKVQLTIHSIHTEKANYEVHGTFLYKIKNMSHFEIEIELDFGKSLHIRTQENNNFEPNKTLFKKHIEPFEDLIASLSKKKNHDDEKGICKVQYNRGYLINAKLRCSFTFPSPEKQRSFVVDDHREIQQMLAKWKKYKPSQIEQIILFTSNDLLELAFDLSDNELMLGSGFTKKSKFHNSKINPRIQKMNESTLNEENKKIFFVDETFPPCQIDHQTMDLSKQIITNPDYANTELDSEKQKTIIFHYRSLESLVPGHERIYMKKEEFSPYDLEFGLIKHQKIIAIFAHLAENVKYLRRLFPYNQLNKIGIYKVRLFLMSGWTNVYVDKFIPCFPMYFPLYVYSQKSLWPCLLEKALAKSFEGGYDAIGDLRVSELYEVLTGMPVVNFRYVGNKFCVNTSYNNIASMKATREDIIEMIKSKNYLCAIYATDEFAKENLVKDKQIHLQKKIFPIQNADNTYLYVKSIYNFQLKKFANFNAQNSDIVDLEWGTFFTLFDSIICIRINLHNCIHFRNGFIRCQDYDSPDYDRVLAHTYYELKVKQTKKLPPKSKEKVLLPTTICLRLSNDHFLDSSFLSHEIDWKIGVLRLEEKISKKDFNERDPFKGKNPILIETPDFVIGHNLICELKLEEGDYIIVPMTMGYCMQKNPKIKFKDYSLRNEDHSVIPIDQTIISKFLNDLFYMNDPFCKNYLDFKVVQQISTNIIDNKGKKIRPIDEEMFNSFCPVIKNPASLQGDFGMSKLLFKDFFYEQMNLLNEEHKKQTMQNLGYEHNTYPYLGRFFGISFYFEFSEYFDSRHISITPKNNLIDNNMDSIVNIRQLERRLFDFKNAEFGKPLRVNLRKENSWYELEGVYMKKGKEQAKLSYKDKLYSFTPNNHGRDVFYSTFKPNVKTIINPGKLLFIMYVVDDILGVDEDTNSAGDKEIEEKIESLEGNENIINEDGSEGGSEGSKQEEALKMNDVSNVSETGKMVNEGNLSGNF